MTATAVVGRAAHPKNVLRRMGAVMGQPSISLLLPVCVLASSCSLFTSRVVPGKGAVSMTAVHFGAQLSEVLPPGWVVVSIRESQVPGREGIYIFARSADPEQANPKGVACPHVALYFRPQSAHSECPQTKGAGSIYSKRLGSTTGYTVYGGAVGADLDGAIKACFRLKEPQNPADGSDAAKPSEGDASASE